IGMPPPETRIAWPLLPIWTEPAAPCKPDILTRPPEIIIPFESYLPTTPPLESLMVTTGARPKAGCWGICKPVAPEVEVEAAALLADVPPDVAFPVPGFPPPEKTGGIEGMVGWLKNTGGA